MKDGLEELEDLNSEDREALAIHEGELQSLIAGCWQEELQPLFPLGANSPKGDDSLELDVTTPNDDFL